MRFRNKVAVITGGNSGIGLATARAFVREGAQVALLGRSETTLEQARRELGGATLTVRGDVRRLPDLERLFSETTRALGKIDILVANAGVARFAPLETLSEELFDEVSGVNFKGAFFTVQRALPHLRDGSAVVLVGTADAERQGRPMTSIYSASKAAVRALARSMSAELMPRRIRVNVLSPGMTDTPIITRSGGLPGATPEEIAQAITATIPMRRRGRPEEMASAILFLCSDEASYFIGAELTPDGGLTQIVV